VHKPAPGPKEATVKVAPRPPMNFNAEEMHLQRLQMVHKGLSPPVSKLIKPPPKVEQGIS